MLKNIKRLLVLAILVVVVLVFAGAFQVVRTEGGYHFIRKKEFSLGVPVVDTRDWKPMDWIRNPDISKALGDIKLDDMKARVSDGWKNFSRKLDGWVEDAEKSLNTESATKDLEKLRKKTVEKYRELARKLENGKIDTKGFEKQLDELETWFREQTEKF